MLNGTAEENTLHMVPKWFRVKLACGHTCKTNVEMSMQYPSDVHYVRCPTCRNSLTILQSIANLTFGVTAWTEIVSVRRVYNVPGDVPLVMPDSILRVQPSVPLNRINVFRYKTRKRR